MQNYPNALNQSNVMIGSAGAQIAAPRLVAVKEQILTAAQRVRENAAMLHAKATSIVGSVPTKQADTQPALSQAANGAVEGIEMAIRDLRDAIDDLSAAEQRLNGLA